MSFSYRELKDRQREIRDSFPESLSLRTHRALSWLCRAEKDDEDLDARFLFLWVAFNAAYANEIPNRAEFPERRLLFEFLNRLIDSDKEQLLYKMVWDQFSHTIRLLIDNKYVFQPFWDYQNDRITEEEWQQKFEHSKGVANTALGRMDTKRVIAVMFDRLYVLAPAQEIIGEFLVSFHEFPPRNQTPANFSIARFIKKFQPLKN